MTRWKTLLFGSAAVAALAAGYGVNSKKLAPATPAPSRAPQTCRFAPGEQLAFNVYSQSTVGNPEDGAAPQRVGLDAVMWWRAVEDRGTAGWVVSALLSNVSLTEGAADPDPARRSALSLPFVVQIGRDCRFRDLRFDPSADAEARRQITGLLRGVELILSPGSGTEWVSRHHDDLGAFDATYRLDPSGAVPTLVRSRSRYASTSTAVARQQIGGRLRVEIVSSQVQAALDPKGRWVRDLNDQEHLRVSLGGKLLTEITAATNLQRIENPAAPPPALASVAVEQLVASLTDPTQQNEAPAPPAPDPTLRAQDLSGAVADFERNLRAGSDGLYRSTQRLAGYLAANPEAISDLVQRIRSGAIDKELHSALFLALQKTRSPTAEKALAAALADRDMPAINRMRAAAALPDIHKPSAQTARTLIDQASLGRGGSPEDRQVAGSALLALGALSHRAGSRQPQLTTLVRDDLTERLRTARAPEERALMLDAIGNTGDKQLAEIVKPQTQDESPLVRSHAAQAFRRMDLSTSEPVLAEWLGSEKEPAVRRSIASALNEKLHEEQRPPSLAVVQSAALQLGSETDPQARAALIELLGRAAASEATAKQALVAQFHRESVSDLQVLIGRYVTAADLH